MMSPPLTPDDQILGAYVDGELDAATVTVIEAAAKTDPALAARIDQARQLRALMSGAFASVMTEPAPERLVRAVAASTKPASAKILRFEGRPEPARAVKTAKPEGPAPSGWSVPVWGAMAACLVAGLTLGVLAPWTPKTDIGLTPGRALTAALDQQASGPSAGPVRIGLSFKAKGGAYCRTFTAGSTAGLACRQAGAWTVKAATPAPAGVDAAYRTASSGTPAAVLDVVDAMIDGAPLDAPAEAKARARGWRR